LNYQKKVLDKGAAFPEGDSSESTNLRQTQMAQQNELDMSNTRLQGLQEQIEQSVNNPNGFFLSSFALKIMAK